MKKIWIVGGTTEARLLAEQLADSEHIIFISVATDYGVQPLSHLLCHDNIKVLEGRLSREEMLSFIKKNNPNIIIDATHPHALLVTRELKSACEELSASYINLERELSWQRDGLSVTACASIDDAIEKLNALSDSGNVFISTGAKELYKYSALENFRERIYARVLPTVSSVESCISLGLSGAQIFCMQGPFSESLNIELFKISGAKYLITKNSGDYGGLSEKLSASRKCDISVFLIEAPTSQDRKSLKEVLRIIGGKE